MRIRRGNKGKIQGFSGICVEIRLSIDTRTPGSKLATLTLITAERCAIALAGERKGHLKMGNFRMTDNVCILKAAFLLLFCAAVGRAQNYDVQGNLKYTVRGENSYENQTDYAFRVSVRGCKWVMETTGRLSTNGTHYVYRDSYDGTNVYCLRLTLEGSKITKSAAVVEQNDIPLHMSFAAPLWLGYASHCYFETLTNNQIKPFWNLGADVLRVGGFTLPAKWSLSKSTPRVPEQVEIFSDGFSYSNDGQTRETIKKRQPPPYDQGFLTAQYQVLQGTNVNNNVLPSEFIFNRFQPVQGGKTPSELRNTATFHVVATRIEPASAPIAFQPQFQRPTLIEDRRGGADPGMAWRRTYITTNTSVPGPDGHIVSTSHAQAGETEVPSRKRKPWLIYTLVGLPTVAVTAFLFFAWGNQRSNRT